MAAPSKYREKSSACTVADMSTTLRSGRVGMSSRSSSKSWSVCVSRSCTSSTTTWLTPCSGGSESIMRSAMPVVQKSSFVLSVRFDSSRTW